jgi:hypothetical protein
MVGRGRDAHVGPSIDAGDGEMVTVLLGPEAPVLSVTVTV